MNRRHLLATAVLAALAGCSAESGPTVATPAAPPPVGAKLVVLKLPAMT
jgi:hypothetical protein